MNMSQLWEYMKWVFHECDEDEELWLKDLICV